MPLRPSARPPRTQVATINGATVTGTRAIIYPGTRATPIKQWRVALLHSNTSAADRAVPAELAFAIARVNAESNTQVPH